LLNILIVIVGETIYPN